MSDNLESLMVRLADGQRHSGVNLAAELGVTRAAVWKRIEALRELGVDIDAAAGGYQLDRPLELLDSALIQSRLERDDVRVETRFLVDSTNRVLATAAWPDHPRALVAEGQSAGRGRRGRGWLSPPGSGVYLSLAWQFESGLTGLAGLSLVAGIAAAEALQGLGVEPVRLKWPNDLVANGRKLGGCLIDIGGSAEGPCKAVIGLGINHYFGQTRQVDQPWTDLAQLGCNLGRNALALALINSLTRACEQLEHNGFGGFVPRWQALDALADESIVAHQADGSQLHGRAGGIDAQGRLRLIDSTDQVTWISGGDVSVRRV